MEIVHFCPRPNFSGLEQYAWLIAQEQKRAGYAVKFVVLEGSPLEKKCAQVGLPVVLLSNLAKMGFGLFADTHDRKILHMHSTLDVHHLWPWLLWRKLFCRDDIKIILQTHIWLDHHKNDVLHKIMYSGIHEVWCSSPMAKKNLEEILPVEAEKIRVINYGRDIKTIDKYLLSREMARHTLKLPEDKIIIGSVNRIDPGKGTLEFVEGMLPLLKEHENLALVWVGPPTGGDRAAAKYNRRIMHFIHELPIEIRERVYFVGTLPESYKYLRAFDGYILPTYKECFSLGLMEAQIAGIPCMGTNSGGTPEIVREGQTGWLFAPRSADAVTEVVKRFLADRANWKLYAQNARLRMEHEFEFPLVFDRLIQMYQG